MLEPGDRISDARVWGAPGDDPVDLREAVAGGGSVLLCFYFFDWSPG
jgi:hypothetical protein